MNDWKKMQIGKAISFNPRESISKGKVAKKVPMGSLTEFQRKINSFELSSYNSGPKFRNGDTIMAKITPCLENGKTAFVDVLENNELAFGSSEYIVLRETEFTDSLFIYYLAISPTFRKRAINCMEGTSGRKRVSEKTLKFFELDFPPISTQKQIAKVLSDLDEKIEVNNKINQELEAMAKTLYDYWFVQFDFPDVNGKPYKSSGGKMVFNEQLKREIPKGWEDGVFGDVADIIGGSTPSKADSTNFTNGNGTPWITPKDLSNNKGKKFITRGEFDVTESGIKKGSLKLMPPRTVLLSSRAPIGYLAIARETVTTNQGFKSFVPKNYFTTEFLYYQIKNKIPLIEVRSGGSTFKEVSASTLKTIKIIMPPSNIIKKYQNKAKPIFDKQNILEKENQKLADLRDWLLPMLMNGQVTVGEVESELGMVAEEGEEYN